MIKSIEKTKSSGFSDYLPYFFGRDPQDEWTFTIDGHDCRFLNGWRSGASLYINGIEVDRNGNLIAVNINKALVTGKVQDSEGRESTLSIYMRAVFGIKIRIKYNDEFIHDGML